MEIDLAFDWFRNLGGDRAILRRNVAWSYHFLKGSGVFVSTLAKLDDQVSGAHKVFKANGLADSEHAWALVYDELDNWPGLANFFLEGISKDCVVGFELSRGQKKLLDKVGKSYIDLRTHPVRFLPDYVFAASTNSPEIHQKLTKLSPNREYIDQHVNFCQARAARRYSKRMNTEVGVVFFAQTAVDSSRIRNGEIVDDVFVLCEIDKHVERMQPKNIYVKHHPHEKMSMGLLNALKKMGAKETNTNTYDLLSTNNLYLMALSSSVCNEAQYFNTRPQMFLDPIENYTTVGEESSVGDYVMLSSKLYHGSIWEHLFGSGDFPHVVYPELSSPYKAASGLSWG